MSNCAHYSLDRRLIKIRMMVNMKLLNYQIDNQNMISPNIKPSQDALDRASQQYSRAKSEYSNQGNGDSASYRHDLMLKNLYKQQLDDIMKQKNQQKRIDQERLNQQKQLYNERVSYGVEAQKMKDLSYKNYYQMLLNNQTKISQNHAQYNNQRQDLKEKLIQNGISQEKKRSQQWWEAEQRRLDNIKKSYRNDLDGQLNYKNFRQAQQTQMSSKQKEEFKKITFTQNEVQKYQRARKQMQMSKYKQDLDRISPQIGERSRIMTGNAIVNNAPYSSSNDFNIHQQRRHDPMVNPMPYNIQNPYILRQFMRKEQQAKQSQPNIFSGNS